MNGSVAPDELLARYITFSKWIRSSNQTVKSDAFIPRDSELSVTRHLHLIEIDIWNIGRKIAAGTHRNLYGRADVETHNIIAQNLVVVPAPDLKNGNPNHANIVSWPTEKNARKIIALEIAQNALFVANPNIGPQNP
jgi:hypothetical protein